MEKIKKEAPRMNSFKPDKVVKPFKDRQRSIKSVRLKKISIDGECKKDIENNNGFFITNEEDFDEKKNVRTIDGLYSPLYGIDTFTDKITDESYHCECGQLSGGINEGDICPECGTVCQFEDAELGITGYINLGNQCVINPACYLDLERLIGGKELQSIIKFNNKFNVNGKNVSTKTKKSPWNGIGLIAFRENFDEIITYYRDKRKKYDDSYYNLIKFKDAVFTHNIPVYSALLRPLIKDESRIAMFDVNRSYSIILVNANNVKSAESPGVDKTIIIENSLYEIQTEYLKIFDDIISINLSTKKGIIRGTLISARVDYSSRSVVTPAIGHFATEVSIPYVTGCELMRPLLIHALNQVDNMNVRDANTMVDNALRKFDKKIWLLMNYILKNSKNPPMYLIQRSPSLLQESIRLMDIKMVKYDINDLTLDVPSSILDGMNADYLTKRLA